MNKLNKYIYELEDIDVLDKESKDYQKEIFEEYVMGQDNFIELRRELLKEYEKGEKLEGKSGLRKRLAAIDLGYFGRAYLPHYFTRKSPKFHAELDDIWTKGVIKNLNPLKDSKKISKLDGTRRAIAAPRGHAKSTSFTFKDTMHSILYEYKHYPIIISDSTEQAEGFLADIKTELEENLIIFDDFGDLQGKVWKTGVILTSTDVKVEAIGSGKKIRGRRHRNWRPDLIVMDDVENDENVNTPDQRRKLYNWFNKAVSKAGDTYTDICYVGTILHYDSLLSKVLNNPEYHSKKYRGVISFAENQALWDAWETIYTDLENEDRQEDAEEFFNCNKEEMLKGAEVLWEEKQPYYKLMVMRISEGESSFNSEIQNDPIDPDNCDFNEEWFDFYDETEIDFSDPRFIIVGANDPSLGKNQKSDTSFVGSLAKDLKTGYMYIVEASIEKRVPDVIIEDVMELSRRTKLLYRKPLFKFGVETVQFQHFFKDVMAQKSLACGEYVPIEEVKSIQNKDIRIKSLQPFVKNKYLKFNAKHKTLLKQMREYPMGKNDDGPDGLEMMVRIALNINTNSTNKYQSILSRKLKFKKGAY